MRVLIFCLFLVAPFAHAESLSSNSSLVEDLVAKEDAGGHRACVNACIEKSAECSQAVDSKGRPRLPHPSEVRSCCEAVCEADGK